MSLLRVSKNRGRRGRPPLKEARSEWKLRLLPSVATPWELILMDPKTQAPKYGARNHLVSELLRLTLEAWQEGREEIKISGVLKTLTTEFLEGTLEEKENPPKP